MPEPVIQLPALTRLGRRFLGDCRWKLKTFVERDAYVEYDHGGGLSNPSLDVITEAHVHAMNCAMRARSSNATWARFVGQEVPVRLSEARILDIILWCDVAIDDEPSIVEPLVRRGGRSKSLNGSTRLEPGPPGWTGLQGDAISGSREMRID